MVLKDEKKSVVYHFFSCLSSQLLETNTNMCEIAEKIVEAEDDGEQEPAEQVLHGKDHLHHRGHRVHGEGEGWAAVGKAMLLV